jgi:hypothetical protein
VKGDEEDNGEFYALAWCSGLYPEGKESLPARLVLYYSPSEGFSRFSFHAYDERGVRCLFHRGPDHSASAEAAVLEGWDALGTPPFAWRLTATEPHDRFASPEHQVDYARARRELCRALYGPRMRAWTTKTLDAAPFFLPPPSGFQIVDVFEETAENEEVLLSMVDDEPASTD